MHPSGQRITENSSTAFHLKIELNGRFGSDHQSSLRGHAAQLGDAKRCIGSDQLLPRREGCCLHRHNHPAAAFGEQNPLQAAEPVDKVTLMPRSEAIQDSANATAKPPSLQSWAEANKP